MKKYNIIYADPPWFYDNNHYTCRGNTGAHYETMGIERIKSLKVGNYAADECFLFLWATFPKIQWALDVMVAWGFTYRTVGFVWVKVTKENRPRLGIGCYTRSNAEICLLGIKGKPRVIDYGVNSIVLAPLMGHSVKPDAVRERIVRLCGDIPRIELFARKKVDGWDAWGNELPPKV